MTTEQKHKFDFVIKVVIGVVTALGTALSLFIATKVTTVIDNSALCPENQKEIDKIKIEQLLLKRNDSILFHKDMLFKSWKDTVNQNQKTIIDYLNKILKKQNMLFEVHLKKDSIRNIACDSIAGDMIIAVDDRTAQRIDTLTKKLLTYDISTNPNGKKGNIKNSE